MRHIFILSALFIIPSVAHAACTREEHPDWNNAQIEQCINENSGNNNSNNGSSNGNSNGNNGSSNNGSSNNEPYNRCNRLYTSAVPGPQPVVVGATQIYASADAPPVAATVTPAPGVAVTMNNDLKSCRGFDAISGRLGASLSATDQRMSQDRKIYCVQKSGITADWESCTSALGMYNAIVVAEAAMQVFQGVQTNRVQGQAQDQFNQRAASGDAQNAAYDAQVTAMNSAKQLNQQQAMAYASAVAALYSKIQSWIKETPEAFSQRGCGQAIPARPATSPTPLNELFASHEAIPLQPNCVSSAQKGFDQYKGFVFANREAKGAFTTAAMMFAAKALQAGIKANQLGAIAKQVTAAKKQTEDPYNPATFEYCQANKLDPKCATPGTVTTGSGLQDGGFGFGDGFGNNAFNPLGDADTLGGVDAGPLAGSDVIPDTSNPFADDAKVASGILDPAGAASIQPGSAGGGGGGGAPGLGGGSASLGNDTPGVDDSKKENDIKANKADGKYGIGGGGAFAAIKPMKDDNPFANLFDGKGGGKLEEDRSIASEIDGQDSGLFSKISRRYGQVQADKRIETKNLDAE